MNESSSNLFSEELKAFARRKEELLRVCEGKYAVFKGADFCGTFDTVEAAYNAGVERFGNVPFLIQPVKREAHAERFPALDLGLLHAHP